MSSDTVTYESVRMPAAGGEHVLGRYTADVSRFVDRRPEVQQWHEALMVDDSKRLRGRENDGTAYVLRKV